MRQMLANEIQRHRLGHVYSTRSCQSLAWRACVKHSARFSWAPPGRIRAAEEGNSLIHGVEVCSSGTILDFPMSEWLGLSGLATKWEAELKKMGASYH